MNVLVGIILYNPDIQRLNESLETLYSQTDSILLINNNSQNIDSVIDLTKDLSKVKIIHNKQNIGVAAALNQMAKFAEKFKYEWLLTLDQDSVIPPNLISIYSKHTKDPSLGIICCRIVDRNFGELQQDSMKVENEYVDLCITSASMINIKVWKAVNGFCSEMFIDLVDFDYCYSVRESGYHILKLNEVSLLHELGHSEVKNFLGKERIILNHSPLRYYYMVRNVFLLGARHNCFTSWFQWALMTFLLVMFYEKDLKIKKIKMMLLGFYHGAIGRFGKLENY